ncbi:MAG: hypothetical protein LBS21_06095 [Clostridiales bacterium]|jgi:hypothetical protein|nr:hypothetical protein [Clostridiales bacterium]
MYTFPLFFNDFARLAKNQDYHFIICGSGRMARDMLKKMQLFGINVEPYIYGSYDNENEGIKYYERLRELKNPKNYKFYLLHELNEWFVHTRTITVVNEITGKIRFESDNTYLIRPLQYLYNETDNQALDMFSAKLYLLNRKSYSICTNHKKNSLKIHIFGGCSIADIGSFDEPAFSVIFGELLAEHDINASIFNYCQWGNGIEKNIMKFISLPLENNADLVLFCISAIKTREIRIATNNLLPKEYNRDVFGEENYGLHFDGNVDLLIDQCRVINTIAKLRGCIIWFCVLPKFFVLPDSLLNGASIRSAGFHERMREKNRRVITKLKKYCIVKDFTDTFDNCSNVFSLFKDENHYAAKANYTLGKRIADEIVNDYDIICEDIK